MSTMFLKDEALQSIIKFVKLTIYFLASLFVGSSIENTEALRELRRALQTPRRSTFAFVDLSNPVFSSLESAEMTI